MNNNVISVSVQLILVPTAPHLGVSRRLVLTPTNAPIELRMIMLLESLIVSRNCCLIICLLK